MKQKITPPLFLALLTNHNLPHPESEYRFAFPRQWKFDYAWPSKMVFLEVEGGVWSGGRHTRGAGFLADMDKYNAASTLGWRMLRTTPDKLASMTNIANLSAVLALSVAPPPVSSK